uniref:Putative type III restriction enzyme n=1 Tax=viral metagenome TaxID=1070528 RepID=A0A6M3II10_9ZZZZ
MEVIDLPSLYAHQEDLRDRTRTALARHGRVILCAQTGVGKTRCAKWILGASANRPRGERASGKTLFVVHRRGLVDNAIDSFSEEPSVPHGVIMAGRETDYSRRIQIASIDTMLSWFVDNGEYPSQVTFDLIVADEVHSHHPKYAKFLKYHDARREQLEQKPAYVIGLTATPRAKGLADVYKEIVQGPSTDWLIENKYLSPFRYFQATQGKLGLLVRRGGEFTKTSESAAMEGLAGDLVRDWKKHAEGRPTVGFFPRRTHAKDAMKELEAAGLRVAYVDGTTPDHERRATYYSLNHHYIDYLCNVQVVERGTDIPRIGCVQLCVAIGSVVRYRQMIGRGSRCHEAKTDCLVLDHGGNVVRHGFFEDDPAWTLDVTTKEPGEVGARPTIECPKCQAIYRGGRCRNCGYEPTPRERRAKGLEFDGRELKEVTRKEKKVSERTPEELMISALFIAAKSGRTWKQCVGIYFGLCTKHNGQKHRVPKFVTVGRDSHRYRMVPYGSDDGGRKVYKLYPFFAGKGHGGDYLVPIQETVGSAW